MIMFVSLTLSLLLLTRFAACHNDLPSIYKDFNEKLNPTATPAIMHSMDQIRGMSHVRSLKTEWTMDGWDIEDYVSFVRRMEHQYLGYETNTSINLTQSEWHSLKWSIHTISTTCRQQAGRGSYRHDNKEGTGIAISETHLLTVSDNVNCKPSFAQIGIFVSNPYFALERNWKLQVIYSGKEYGDDITILQIINDENVDIKESNNFRYFIPIDYDYIYSCDNCDDNNNININSDNDFSNNLICRPQLLVCFGIIRDIFNKSGRKCSVPSINDNDYSYTRDGHDHVSLWGGYFAHSTHTGVNPKAVSFGFKSTLSRELKQTCQDYSKYEKMTNENALNWKTNFINSLSKFNSDNWTKIETHSIIHNVSIVTGMQGGYCADMYNPSRLFAIISHGLYGVSGISEPLAIANVATLMSQSYAVDQLDTNKKCNGEH